MDVRPKGFLPELESLVFELLTTDTRIQQNQ